MTHSQPSGSSSISSQRVTCANQQSNEHPSSGVVGREMVHGAGLDPEHNPAGDKSLGGDDADADDDVDDE